MNGERTAESNVVAPSTHWPRKKKLQLPLLFYYLIAVHWFLPPKPQSSRRVYPRASALRMCRVAVTGVRVGRYLSCRFEGGKKLETKTWEKKLEKIQRKQSSEMKRLLLLVLSSRAAWLCQRWHPQARMIKISASDQVVQRNTAPSPAHHQVPIQPELQL